MHCCCFPRHALGGQEIKKRGVRVCFVVFFFVLPQHLYFARFVIFSNVLECVLCLTNIGIFCLTHAVMSYVVWSRWPIMGCWPFDLVLLQRVVLVILDISTASCTDLRRFSMRKKRTGRTIPHYDGNLDSQPFCLLKSSICLAKSNFIDSCFIGNLNNISDHIPGHLNGTSKAQDAPHRGGIKVQLFVVV